MSLVLVRYNYASDLTQGFIHKDNKFFCDSLELPWKDNKPFLSCIPEGVYRLRYREDHNAHIKKAYIVEGVPNRTGILIHVANAVSELKGCIAIGVRSADEIFRSAITFEALRELIGTESELKITGAYHGL